MRAFRGLVAAGLVLAAPTAASAQGAPDAATGPAVTAVDRAGETAATRGAPGTVVPDTAGVAVAPGVQAPVETPVKPASPQSEPVPAAK